MEKLTDSKVVFRADSKVFFSKMFYQLLELVALTVVASAIVLVVGFIIPFEGIHDGIFHFFQRVMVDWSPFFPFSLVVFAEFFMVCIVYVFKRQKVVISDQGAAIRKWGRCRFFPYEQGEFSFSHVQKRYWKRNEIEYFFVYTSNSEKEQDSIESFELFCFGGNVIQKLEKEIKQKKKRAEGVLLDESDTEFLQTKPVTVYIPKKKILEKEWRVTIGSFAGGIVACGGIGYLLFRYGEIWEQRVELRLSLLAVLIFFSALLRLIRTVLDQKNVPERIYISGEYLVIDGTSFWLKDVDQIEFSEKSWKRIKVNRTGGIFNFCSRGKRNVTGLEHRTAFRR